MASTGGLYQRSLLGLRKSYYFQLEQAAGGVARNLELLDRSMVRLFATRMPLAAQPARRPRNGVGSTHALLPVARLRGAEAVEEGPR